MGEFFDELENIEKKFVLILVCVEVSVGVLETLTVEQFKSRVLILVCVEVSVGARKKRSYGNFRGVLILVCVEVSVGAGLI